MEAGPVLNEPIMTVEIIVPEANMGDILGDLNTRRARVQGMNSEKGHSIVNAHVPLAEMLRYTTQLRSMTGGRGDLHHGVRPLRGRSRPSDAGNHRCAPERKERRVVGRRSKISGWLEIPTTRFFYFA